MVAQLVERLTVNQDVGGSSPPCGAVAVAQMDRAAGCDPADYGFKSRQSPWFYCLVNAMCHIVGGSIPHGEIRFES